MKHLRRWWHAPATGGESAFDRDTPAWAISLLVNVSILVALALFGTSTPTTRSLVTYMEPEEDIPLEEEIIVPQEFAFSEVPVDEIGAQSVDGATMAASLAPILDEVSDVPTPPEPLETSLVSEMKVDFHDERVVEATGLTQSDRHIVRGAAGVGTTGAMGAIDRITHEILISLQQRKTMVIWAFDSTVSLSQQRKQLHDRMDRIYAELGAIEASANPAFAQHDDKPLLTSVYAFGKTVESQIKVPTDNLAEIKMAIKNIPIDRSGQEHAFEAVYAAAEAAKRYAYDRNVLIIVFTDEVGDDQSRADDTIKLCRKFHMPVYVVGVPAPFGRNETEMKWIDPDPAYDQTPQWGRVEQGPESRFPEVVKLHFVNARADEPMDSGYGPYALTRLSVETGGIYFSVHPNRDMRHAISREETANLSAHLKYFFDPDAMRRYQPDYVSDGEYQKLLNENKARQALVQAASLQGWITPLSGPALHFPKRDDADLARKLTEAQKAAAKLEPVIGGLYSTLKIGEADRPKLDSPRWQAGYDLAMGRVLAAKVRTEAYNAMLAKAKTMKFKNPKNDTWDLEPADTIDVGSALEKDAVKAKEYLDRVVANHPGTPWAMLAAKELETPLGWQWQERYTGVNAPKPPMGTGTPPPPTDDKAKMLPKPPPKRAVPPL
ncbi:MAG: VWA domain-containing protein [Pirellulales bacterium]